MEIVSKLMLGFSIALTPFNLLYCFVGVTIGTLIGVLPGIGPTAGIALLIPVSLSLPPTTAIIMLAGIYYGSMYGGSTTAILINTPGEAASIPTALDGYRLARQGRAGAALAMAAIASFVAGTFSLIGLMLLAPPLAAVALAFGPPEYFSLMFLGLTIVVSLAGKSLLKGLVSALFGIMISSIGMDPISGVERFSYGDADLLAGIDFISVVVGLFAITEILINAEESMVDVFPARLKGLWPTWQDWKNSKGALARSSVLGFLIGLLPGASASIAAFICYDVEKKCSKHPEKFGQGAVEGVAAAEGANNSAVGGGLVPLLTLGIPPSAPLAVLLGALMIHGLRPGPLLFEQNPNFVWGLVASMYIGNLMLLVLNLPLVGFWARLIRVPYPILAPIVLALCVIGAYGIRNNMFDVWVALILGVIGFFMRKLDFPAAPVILAIILAPMIENALRQSLGISRGDMSIFFTRPISAGLLILAAGSLALSIYGRIRESSKTRHLIESASSED
jgi:putative tricarboxylic transport membrane protein